MESIQESTKFPSKLYAAIGNVQYEVAGYRKDKKNPHFNSMHGSIESVKEVLDPLLEKNHLVFTCKPVIDGIECTMFHSKSGEYERWITPYFINNNTNPQDLGKCLTYFRRYELVNYFNLASEDDDGEAGRKASKHTPSKTVQKQAPVHYTPAYSGTEEQKDILDDVFEALGIIEKSWKQRIHKLLINRTVEASKGKMLETARWAMDQIESGNEEALEDIPFKTKGEM